MTDIADNLAILQANAIANLANYHTNLPSKQDRATINGQEIAAYAIRNSGRNSFKNWASVRWYLNGKVVSRANLIKALNEAAA